MAVVIGCPVQDPPDVLGIVAGDNTPGLREVGEGPMDDAMAEKRRGGVRAGITHNLHAII